MIKIDAKERKLLQLLDFHARDSISSLAKKLKMSKQGVLYKLKGLENKEIIKGYYPIINGARLGYMYCRLGIVLQNADIATTQRIINSLKEQEFIIWIFTTQGPADILAVMRAKSRSEFYEKKLELLHLLGKYCKTIIDSIAIDVIHYPCRFLTQSRSSEVIHLADTNQVIEIDDSDKQILSILCDNARASLLSIAKKTRLNTKTVAKHIKDLEQKKVIEGYRPQIDFNKLGYSYIKILFHLNYSHFEKLQLLLESLSHNPAVYYIVKTIGLPYDLDVEVMVKTNEELYLFVQSLKEEFPQLIGEYTSFIFIETKKVRYLPW